MKYALVNNIKSEATKGTVGLCQCCGSILIAKCGAIKVNHWAHKGRRKCDNWWEGETNWHRRWKNKFPIKWQEVIMHDQNSGEKHIADVKTEQGLVIEFQHSYIKRDEQNSREQFYKNMLWVVNGARLKHDYPRFLKGKKDFKTIKDNKNVFAVEYADEYLPKNWIKSDVPVVFDFYNAHQEEYDEDLRSYLYCLFPNQLGRFKILAQMTRIAFTNSIMEGSWSERADKFISNIYTSNQNELKRKALNDLIFNEIFQKAPKRRVRNQFGRKQRL